MARKRKTKTKPAFADESSDFSADFSFDAVSTNQKEQTHEETIDESQDDTKPTESHPQIQDDSVKTVDETSHESAKTVDEKSDESVRTVDESSDESAEKVDESATHEQTVDESSDESTQSHDESAAHEQTVDESSDESATHDQTVDESSDESATHDQTVNESSDDSSQTHGESASHEQTVDESSDESTQSYGENEIPDETTDESSKIHDEIAQTQDECSDESSQVKSGSPIKTLDERSRESTDETEKSSDESYCEQTENEDHEGSSHEQSADKSYTHESTKHYNESSPSLRVSSENVESDNKSDSEESENTSYTHERDDSDEENEPEQSFLSPAPPQNDFGIRQRRVSDVSTFEQFSDKYYNQQTKEVAKRVFDSVFAPNESGDDDEDLFDIGVSVELDTESGICRVSGFKDLVCADLIRGLSVGDIITKIDDVDILGMSLDKICQRLEGKKNSECRIQSMTGEQTEVCEFRLRRIFRSEVKEEEEELDEEEEEEEEKIESQETHNFAQENSSSHPPTASGQMPEEIASRFELLQRCLNQDSMSNHRFFQIEIPVQSNIPTVDVNKNLEHTWLQWISGVVCVQGHGRSRERQLHMLEQLAKTGLLNLAVIVTPLPGVPSTTLTQKLAAKIALEMQNQFGYEKVLILEDNFQFDEVLSSVSILNLRSICSRLPRQWNTCALAHMPMRMCPVPSTGNKLFTTCSITMPGMIVNAPAWNSYFSRKVRSINTLSSPQPIPSMLSVHFNNPNAFAIYPMNASVKFFPPTNPNASFMSSLAAILQQKIIFKIFEWISIHLWNLVMVIAIFVFTFLLV